MFVYVSDWGGRIAKAGDSTATTGIAGPDEPPKRPQDVVVTDSRGIAATGSVTRIDEKLERQLVRFGWDPILRRFCGTSLEPALRR